MFIRIEDQVINTEVIRSISKQKEALYWYVDLNISEAESKTFGPFTEEQADSIIYETAKALEAKDLTQIFFSPEG